MTMLRSATATPVPDERRRRAVRLVTGASTPSRLWRLGAVLVVFCLVTALISAVWGWTRTTTTGDEGARLASLDYDTAELYEALRGADASAATGIGADSTTSPTALARYDSYVTSAYLRLDHARGLLEPGGDGAAKIEEIVYELPRYTAAVDAARTLRDRAARDDPARGQADVAEARANLFGASQLMRSVLATADELQRDQAGALAENYARAGRFPLPVVLACLVTLAALGVVSVREARRTKRVLNAGLIAATALTVLALAWWLTTALVADGDLDAARSQNATAAGLGDLRTTMLQARSSETTPQAGAAADGAPPPTQQIFGDFDRVLRPGGTLDAAQQGSDAGQPGPGFGAVRDSVTAWRTAIRDRGAGSEASRVGFVRLTATVGDAIDTTRGRRTAAIDDAARWLTGLAVGPSVLMVLAAIATGLGVAIRLREYPGGRRSARGMAAL